MKLKSIWAGVALCALGASVQAQATPANHLLLSEMQMDCNNPESPTDGSSEFVEIYNPTDETIDLTNYYLTDDNTYYNFPSFYDIPEAYDLGGGDYMLQFPAGATIEPGQVVVVAYFATDFLQDFYGSNLANYTSLPGSPKLFESHSSHPGVPDMITHNANADVNSAQNMSHTNGGEFVVLMYWDGLSDLVEDVDIVSYGTPGYGNDNMSNRTGWAVDGPDADTAGTEYTNDGGLLQTDGVTDLRSMDLDAGFQQNMMVRRSTIEVGEQGTTGNGFTGQDETMEWVWDTWTVSEGQDSSNLQLCSPGTTELVKNSENPTPFIGHVSRDIQYPGLNTPIKITCAAGAVNAPVVSVYVNTGGSFTKKPMTLNPATREYEATVGPFTQDTYVQYYFEAADGANIGRYPLTTGDLRYPFFGDYFGFHVSDNFPTADDLKFTEIMYDPPGGNNTGWSQFIEVYNTRSTPINISNYCFADYATYPERGIIQPGAVIPGNGYLVLACARDVFLADYPLVDPSKVFEIVEARTGAACYLSYAASGTTGDTPNMSHANAYRWGNRPTVSFMSLTYESVSPWPSGKNNQGPSIELKSVGLDNTVGSNWAYSVEPNGSPAAPNQGTSLVSDWSVY